MVNNLVSFVSWWFYTPIKTGAVRVVPKDCLLPLTGKSQVAPETVVRTAILAGRSGGSGCETRPTVPEGMVWPVR